MKVIKNIVVPVMFLVAATTLSVFLAENPRREEAVEESELLSEEECEISIYDRIFQRIGEHYNIDWRFLSAIACAESRFDADARSPRGAVGLMQVMPFIASSYGISAEEAALPANNIEAAAKLIKDIRRMLRIRKIKGETNRNAFVAACYHCGYSHVNDARKIALLNDDDPDDWYSVADYLCMLSDEAVYTDEVVTGGRFQDGFLTVAYVDKVLRLYARYVAASKKTNSRPA